ncbi:hypothetical protein H4219_001304 [Mycoemilia scoparia]|uniref:Cleavage stimulation factor 50 kDa subunit n=1 Tax=Mycoemilia scoparia TaxID=417184 RepID=A0A9W8A0K0_9FUNG|nr:hypothetical protein H4219_001304 [Mycoemilia scoparia]
METEIKDGVGIVKKEAVLSLIVSQLTDYGYNSLATAVAKYTNVEMSAESNSMLAQLLYIGNKYKDEGKSTAKKSPEAHEDGDVTTTTNAGFAGSGGTGSGNPNDDMDGISEDESEVDGLLIDGTKGGDGTNEVQNTAPDYIMWYQTTHKGPATAAAFSRNGQYLATGSADTTLKVIDTDRIKSPTQKTSIEEKPVVRTLYDHQEGINDLTFHPNGIVLASCSDDRSIKLFDLSVSQGKRSFRYMYDSHTINSISFHPSGDFLAAGTTASELRIYDIKTFQCYIPSGSNGSGEGNNGGHTKGIVQTRYAHNGSLIATASLDGSVKIWDGVDGSCVRTLENAHGGSPVTSVNFSRNTKYILTCGRDSLIKLWEVGSGRLVHDFAGSVHKKTVCQASFTHDEAFVISGDEATNTITCWDSRTGTFLKRYGGQNQSICQIAASPSFPAFVSCS